jgi:uncharacterized protein (DUF2249 family)
MPAEHVEIEARPAEPAAGGHACGCHEAPEEIVLDARSIPHAIRHATIRGAFGAIPEGGSMVLVAPHNPVPLLAQLSGDARGALHVEYLADEPGECHVRLTRLAAPQD